MKNSKQLLHELDTLRTEYNATRNKLIEELEQVRAQLRMAGHCCNWFDCNEQATVEYNRVLNYSIEYCYYCQKHSEKKLTEEGWIHDLYCKV